MIKQYTEYIKEAYGDNYQKILSIITKLVDDGEIVLKTKTPTDITDIITGKKEKYPQFGFESMIFSFSEGREFVSEADKEKMGEYVKRIKNLGFDVTELEKLLPEYEEYRELNLMGDDRIRDDYELSEDEQEEAYIKLNDKIWELKSRVVDKVHSILKDLSKKVAEKL